MAGHLRQSNVLSKLTASRRLGVSASKGRCPHGSHLRQSNVPSKYRQAEGLALAHRRAGAHHINRVSCVSLWSAEGRTPAHRRAGRPYHPKNPILFALLGRRRRWHRRRMPFTYIVRCVDDTLYVGHTDDLASREQIHNRGHGAKYTATRAPVRMVYAEEHASIERAVAREHQLKRWATRRKKRSSVATEPHLGR